MYTQQLGKRLRKLGEPDSDTGRDAELQDGALTAV